MSRLNLYRSPFARHDSAHLSYWMLFVCGLIWADRPSPLAAQDQRHADARFQAQLEAGEFAPATRTAAAMRRGPDRDSALARLSAAQAGAGATNSAYVTASQVDDDSLRANTLARTKQTAAGRFGGSQADFDSLIDLITSTIEPNSWDTAGGPGSVQSFEGGVY